MNKILVAALTVSVSVFAAAPALAENASASAPSAAVATKGKMLVSSDGARLAPVYRVASDGPQIILDGRMVTVPGNTLSTVDGKLITSLTKGQVIALP